MTDTQNLERLVESARLTGRIDLLMEMRDWLNDKIQAAETANEQLREHVESQTA